MVTIVLVDSEHGGYGQAQGHRQRQTGIGPLASGNLKAFRTKIRRCRLRQLVNALEEFRALGIDFVSIHEGVDTSTPNGRLVFGIFASIAEFERELIRERVRSCIAAAKAKGKRFGRPRVVVDAPRIAALRAQGRSWVLLAYTVGICVQNRVVQMPSITLKSQLVLHDLEAVERQPSLR